jgi:hypothetical protein
MRWVGPIIVVCILTTNNLCLILLMTRYVVIERFRKQPIIYLRSFHYDGATETFGNAIAPAISRFGVVEGLVHGEQKSSNLIARASIWQFGQMIAVLDGQWKDWVTNALRYANAVIIDCSVLTKSVTWEIVEAFRSVGRHRVLLIANESTPDIGATGAQIVRYGRGPDAMQQLRAGITDWARLTISGRTNT